MRCVFETRSGEHLHLRYGTNDATFDKKKKKGHIFSVFQTYDLT